MFWKLRYIEEVIKTNFPWAICLEDVLRMCQQEQFSWKGPEEVLKLSWRRLEKVLKEPWRRHCVKSVCIWSCSGPYFPAFGLNTQRYGVSLRIQSECGKIRTRITPNTGIFHTVRVTEMILFASIKATWRCLEDSSCRRRWTIFSRCIHKTNVCWEASQYHYTIWFTKYFCEPYKTAKRN